VPASGNASGSITFGAYGTSTSSPPIISGASLITPWTSDSGTSTETVSRVGSPDDGGAFSFGWRHIVAANSFSNNGSAFRITLEARSDQAMTVTGVYIGKQASSGDAYDYDPADNVHVLFGGSGSVVVPAGGTVTSDWITYTTTKTNTYVISYGTTGGYRGAYGGGNNAYVKTNDQNGYATADVSGYGSIIANWGGIVSFAIQYTSVGVANVWNSTVTTQPNAVYFDGVRGTLEASKASITGANEWYWASNVLSVYSVGSPVLSNPGIEASIRNYPINTNSQNYITVQNISALKAALNGVYASWQPNTVVLDGLDVSDSYDSGVVVNGTSAAFTIKNSTVENSGLYGIIHNHPNGTNQYITNNNVRNNGWRPSNTSGWNGTLSTGEISGNAITNNGIGATAGFGHGLYNDTGQANSALKIYDNTISGNTKGAGILNKSSAEIYNNKIYSNNNEGISTGQNGTTNVVYNIHNNIIYSNSGGMAIKTKGAGTIDSTIYNNTLYQNGAAHEIYVGDNDTSLVLKNNIVYALDTGDNATIVTQGALTSTNNVWYRPAGFTLTYGGSSKSWAQWTALSFDANSVNADPKLNSPTTDFSLQSTSPAIDAGTNLGSTYQLALTSSSTWPSSIVTLNQNSYGSGWDIGAYVYTQTSTPSVVMTAPANLATVTSTVTISASSTAVSPASISSVQFYLDGSPLGSPVTSTSSPDIYSYSWNTASLTDGSHTLSALATDNYGNTATSSNVTLTAVNTPPVLSNGSPANSFFPYGTTQTTLSLTTNESSTCRYGTVPNTAYASLSNTFASTGGTSHSQSLTGLTSGGYAYYVRCIDIYGNADTNDYPIAFTILGPAVGVASAYGVPNYWVTANPSLTASSSASSSVSVSSSLQAASSTAELLDLLAALQSKLAALQAQANHSFSRNLSFWSTGSDVKQLQLFLISQASGPAAAKLAKHGTTTIFGMLTFNALVEFQKSVGIVPASGYFGPKTRGWVNAMGK
jgi:hypothetical protein